MRKFTKYSILILFFLCVSVFKTETIWGSQSKKASSDWVGEYVKKRWELREHLAFGYLFSPAKSGNPGLIEFVKSRYSPALLKRIFKNNKIIVRPNYEKGDSLKLTQELEKFVDDNFNPKIVFKHEKVFYEAKHKYLYEGKTFKSNLASTTFSERIDGRQIKFLDKGVARVTVPSLVRHDLGRDPSQIDSSPLKENEILEALPFDLDHNDISYQLALLKESSPLTEKEPRVLLSVVGSWFANEYTDEPSQNLFVAGYFRLDELDYFFVKAVRDDPQVNEPLNCVVVPVKDFPKCALKYFNQSPHAKKIIQELEAFFAQTFSKPNFKLTIHPSPTFKKLELPGWDF
jgi:hypothetical protein